MNVLFICVDDLKPALGCYASPLVKNLNLDRFAQRSVRFDMVFCNQTGCFPSGNFLVTGLRPQSLIIYYLASNFMIAGCSYWVDRFLFSLFLRRKEWLVCRLKILVDPSGYWRLVGWEFVDRLVRLQSVWLVDFSGKCLLDFR